jgi:Na+-driven multidrug efflux pump
MYRKLRAKTVLVLPRRIEKLSGSQKKSLYSVGIPAAFAIFLFDLVTIVTNRLTVAYGDIPLAAMGIVLKLERIPINVGLGVCLGMVPLIAYNFGAGNRERMQQILSLARIVIVSFSCVCVLLFWLFACPLVGAFISDEATILQGATFLRGRCFALPFMMIGYHIVNYMNAVNQGKISFLLALIRHIALIIPIMLVMNRAWGLDGLIWSQLAADAINAVIASVIFSRVNRKI